MTLGSSAVTNRLISALLKVGKKCMEQHARAIQWDTNSHRKYPRMTSANLRPPARRDNSCTLWYSHGKTPLLDSHDSFMPREGKAASDVMPEHTPDPSVPASYWSRSRRNGNRTQRCSSYYLTTHIHNSSRSVLPARLAKQLKLNRTGLINTWTWDLQRKNK